MKEFLIKNGLIINGKNEPAFYGDIQVRQGKILRIAPCLPVPLGMKPEQVLEVKGACVTPGFVDIHRHGDWQALKNGDDELLNRQGITTVVNGNCGLSVAPAGERFAGEIRDFLSSVTGRMPDIRCVPFVRQANAEAVRKLSEDQAYRSYGVKDTENRFSEKTEKRENISEPDRTMEDYLHALSGVKRSVNTGMLAGNGTIRACVKGYAPGKLNREELHAVWKTLEESLEAGALGVSLGLAYAPEFEYTSGELQQVLEPLRGQQIPITVHVRNEGDGLLPALEEITEVARALDIPLHVSHMKCIGRRNWGGKRRKALELFDRAEAGGVKVDFDLYPYLTGSTQLVHVLPPEFQKGGAEAIMKRLEDRTCREELTRRLAAPSEDFENIVELVGFEQIYASTLHTPEYGPYAGWSIARMALELCRDPYELLYDLLLAEKCQVTMLDTVGCEEDMLAFLADRRASLISDAIYPEGGKYHPRVYGGFPRFLVDYVREKKVFSIEEAIYRMTGKPAAVLGIDRGTLEEGKTADINVFYLKDLKVSADFQHPDQMCEGFQWVFTGGEPVVEQDVWTNRGSGQVLKRGH